MQTSTSELMIRGDKVRKEMEVPIILKKNTSLTHKSQQ